VPHPLSTQDVATPAGLLVLAGDSMRVFDFPTRSCHVASSKSAPATVTDVRTCGVHGSCVEEVKYAAV
jgi:hypothetical protein